MGNATEQARAEVKGALDATSGIDLGVARELFGAAAVVGGSSPLAGALGDWATDPQARAVLATRVFGGTLGESALRLLTAVVTQRWAHDAELVEAIEEAAIRAASVAAAGVDLEGELFGVSRLVAGSADLELALGSRVGDDAQKGALLGALLEGRVSEATALIATQLVVQLRGRRIRPLLARAERLVADQRGATVATVTSAAPLSDAQAERLRTALAARYGGSVTLNAVIDPAVVGGVRVQIADELMDASVSARLSDLRQRLAG